MKIHVKGRVLRQAIREIVREERSAAIARPLVRVLRKRWPDEVDDGLEARIAALGERSINRMYERLPNATSLSEVLGRTALKKPADQG